MWAFSNWLRAQDRGRPVEDTYVLATALAKIRGVKVKTLKCVCRLKREPLGLTQPDRYPLNFKLSGKMQEEFKAAAGHKVDRRKRRLNRNKRS